MAGGRPSKYTDKLDTTICGRLANGESLNAICKDSKMPSRVTVYAWLKEGKGEFLNNYTQARERQAETFVDECTDIADSTDKDYVTLQDKDGNDYEKADHDHINRSRLRVDTRIKIAAMLAPRKYSTKHDVKLSGDININIIDKF